MAVVIAGVLVAVFAVLVMWVWLYLASHNVALSLVKKFDRDS